MKKAQQEKFRELAARIRAAREYAQLSQRELGDAIGVSDKSVSAYEKGRAIPPLKKLKQIAEQTKTRIGYFTESESLETIIEKKLSLIEQELVEIRDLLKKKH